ncbi:30S ribosomal protein S21 [Candidatus Poribacteria bacterium]
MLEIRVQENESIDRALRRFKKQCDKEALIKEVKRRKHYMKPSERRRQRSAKNQRRSMDS